MKDSAAQSFPWVFPKSFDSPGLRLISWKIGTTRRMSNERDGKHSAVFARF